MYKSMLPVALLGCLFSQAALGWGQTGHRVTGALAERYLTPEAQKQVQALFPDDSLAEISTYADEKRSDTAHFWQKTAGPFHYVTVPEGKHYDEVGAPPQGDAVTALARFKTTLTDPKASAEEKRLALHFTVHIIGDLHQPLHAGNGTDRGGNDVEVTFFWERSNLHRVWDSGMIDRQQLSYTEWTDWLDQKIRAADVQAWQQHDPTHWIAESTALRDGVYPLQSEISWEYQYQHLPTVKSQLQKAGVRIAAYLNALFAPSQQEK